MRNVKFGKPIIEAEEKNAVMEVLGGDILVHGPKAKEFEQAFSKFTGAPASVSLSSCTAGLHLSYFYLKLGPGDEVIVPAQTHNATAHAVEYTGARPVFVDAELKTGNIDIDRIEAAITGRTKALSLVHFLGMPVAMDKINAIAEKYNLPVIEDCALAVGARYKNKHVGLWGDAGCFSFYPVKHMTTGEGGMLISKHPEWTSTIERQKAFGVDRHAGEREIPGVYDVNMLGYNYRMNEIAAAIGCEQMKKIAGFIDKRKRNFDILYAKLKELPELHLFESSNGDFQSSYYCLSVILDDRLKEHRVEIINNLKAAGIGTSIYYPAPVPHLSYYSKKYNFDKSCFPNAAKISYNSIAFPVGQHLDGEDMEYIASKLKNIIGEITKK